MRTALQHFADRRRHGRPPIETPEDLIRAFEARHGDRALPVLVRTAAEEYGPVFTADRVRYLKAIRILIHRALAQTRVFREASPPSLVTPWVASARVDPYTPGYWTGD